MFNYASMPMFPIRVVRPEIDRGHCQTCTQVGPSCLVHPPVWQFDCGWPPEVGVIPLLMRERQRLEITAAAGGDQGY